MSTLRTRYSPALYSVGGRRYRLVDITPNHVRFEDTLDGHCLSFTQDEAFRMLVQEDLIIVGPQVLRDFTQALADVVNAPKPAARQSSMSPNHAAAEDVLHMDTVQRHCRCTTQQQEDHERLARLGDRPTERVRLIILDEFSRYKQPDAVIRAQLLARLKVDARALKLCPASGSTRCGMPHPPPVVDDPTGEDRWHSEGRSRAAAKVPCDYRLKTPAWTLITLLGTTQWSLKGTRPSPVEALPRPVRGVAVELAGSPRATPDRGRNPALDAEVDDVE